MKKLRNALLLSLIVLSMFAFSANCMHATDVMQEAEEDTNIRTIHGNVDIFNGSFSQCEIAVAPKTTFDVSFNIRPSMDVPKTQIHFTMPSDLVKLVKGKQAWMGDIKCGEAVTLALSFEADEEVDVYVRADVEASPKGQNFASSYYLHVVTTKKSLDSLQEYLVASRQLSSSEVVEESVPESPGSITISGRWLYIDENGMNVPMRQIKVVLMDEDTGVDEEVAWKYTDNNGYYSFTVNNDDGFLQDGRDPYIKVYSDGICAYCKTSGGGWYFSELPKCKQDAPDGFTYNYGTWYTTEKNEAWQAIDACLSERNWIYTRSSPNWERSTKVDIRWPKETWPHSHGNSIHLPLKSTWAWNHVTVHHEYAHCVMWALYGHWPPGSGPSPHYVFSESSGGFAICEGWAEFMQCAVDNKITNLQGWYSGHGGDVETNDWYNCLGATDMDGGIVEGSVASIFWDIIDGQSTTDADHMTWSFGLLFTVIRNDKPDNMDEFWTKWKTRWPTVSSSVGPLCTVYWHYGIDKDAYQPYAGSISINKGAEYTNSRSVTLTLSCSDWGSGVFQMRFRNSLDDPWSAWYTYATSKSWTLSTGDGTKFVYVEFTDKKGLTSIYYDTIILDTTRPTVTKVSVSPTSFSPKLGQTTKVSYTLSEPCYITAKIYNSAGKVVRTLLNNVLKAAGSNSDVWNGKNDAGSIVPNGKYTIKIWITDRAGNKLATYPVTITVTVV